MHSIIASHDQPRHQAVPELEPIVKTILGEGGVSGLSKLRPVLVADLLKGNSGVLDGGGPALLNLGKIQLVPDKHTG